MSTDEILAGKRVLAVDDEPDILETLEEILDDCEVETASSYEMAKELLKAKSYDAAVLDIMGVRGFDLLELANEKGVPALMLTAHGLNPDNLVGSIQLGAKSYIPKDKINDLPIFLEEIFTAKEEGIEKSGNWFVRLSTFFDQRFGHGWKNKDKKFWREFDKTYQVNKDELQDIL